MSYILSLGSILLGIISWTIPIIAIKKEFNINKSIKMIFFSFISCAVAIILQIFEIKNRVNLQDWSAIMDTIDTLCWISILFLIITVVINFFCLNLAKK